MNCGKHPTFCRRKKIGQFPSISIYLSEVFEHSFADMMRLRLLSTEGKYTVCPYSSDFSYTGLKTALQELGLLPTQDPHLGLKAAYYTSFVEALK